MTNMKEVLYLQVMYFFNDACLLIACNQSWPSGCDPLLSKDERFADAFLLRVRDAGIAVLTV
jgi:hypothetical protein